MCGIQTNYSSSNASTKLGETEFNFTHDANTNNNSTHVSHYEAINLHKAKGGYGLDGDNIKVGIIDTGFNTSHSEFDGGSRTISTSTAGGSLSSNHGLSLDGYHGAVVASLLEQMMMG